MSDRYVWVEGMVHERADGGGTGLVTVPSIVHGCQGNKEPKDQHQEEQEAEDELPNAKQPASFIGGTRGERRGRERGGGVKDRREGREEKTRQDV